MTAPIVRKAGGLLRGVEGILNGPGEILKVSAELKAAYNQVLYGGKEKYGKSVYIEDRNEKVWKIKVRWRGDRGHYLKVKRYPKHSKDEKFRQDFRP